LVELPAKARFVWRCEPPEMALGFAGLGVYFPPISVEH